MIKRRPEAIVAAAKMDPNRRELYVEGISDKIFIEFFCHQKIDPDIRILPIDHAMDCAISDGGCKGRVLHLANLADLAGLENLRFLVDSDQDGISGIRFPCNTISTDLPDIEAHSISLNSLKKLIMVGYGQEVYSIKNIYEKFQCICGEIGLLRYAARINFPKLAINNTKFDKCITLIDEVPVFNMEKFIINVIQNTKGDCPSVKHVNEWMSGLRDMFERFPLEQRIRGKDYQELLAQYGRKSKLKWNDPAAVMMATIEPEAVLRSLHFREILDFFES